MTDPTATLPRQQPARRRRLGAKQWLLLGETLATLATASAAIGVLPFRRVVALASRRRIDRSDIFRRADVDELRWAVEAISRRVPWRTVCFQKGLALQLMLRRRGAASLLHYGVGMGEGELAAHVWISVDGEIVLGGEVIDRFCCLATYPSPSSQP